MVLPHELYRLDGLFGVLDCTTPTNFYELYHLDGLFGVLDGTTPTNFCKLYHLDELFGVLGGTTLQTLRAVSSRWTFSEFSVIPPLPTLRVNCEPRVFSYNYDWHAYIWTRIHYYRGDLHLIIYCTTRTHIHCIYVLVHGINKGIDSIRIDDNWTGCSYGQALTL